MDERLRRFILEHEGEDTTRLLLSRAKYPGIDMSLAASTIEGRSRMRRKAPSWYNEPGIIYPSRLCCEQCSSEKAARYKAAAAASIASGGRIADLTGGLGIDSWAFASVSSEVLYNERNEVLAKAAEANFNELGIRNIETHSEDLVPGGAAAILGDFRPDLIYLDPARRSEEGKKVFLLEDCSPDILTLKDELLGIAPVLLKLSPMADITMLVKRLGSVKKIWITGFDGECKEILVHLEKDYDGPWDLTVCEEGNELDLKPSDEPEPQYLEGPQDLGDIIFEPGKALSKAAVPGYVCSLFGLRQLDRGTNLFTAKSPVSDGSAGFGKIYRILQALPLDKRSISAFTRLYPDSAVTARNIPLDTNELRKRLGSNEKGDTHIFGCRLAGQNYLLATRRDI